jgi:hypothetical protein
MDAKGIIDSYVGDVARHLPRRQRNDVARELQSLLDEELEGRAADTGRPADSAMTMDLLTAFGRPQEVADRYRPAGFTIIRPSDAPRFAWVSLGGIAVVWAITLPSMMLGLTPVVGWEYGADTWWGRLTVWWLGPGLGAFWWPGFIFTFTLIAALVNRRREASATWTPAPRGAIDRDLVNRPVGILYLALGMLGATVLIALPLLGTWAPNLPQPVLDALALDPDFVRSRAPWILLLWAAYLVLYLLVLRAGRWSVLALRVSAVLSLLTLGLLLWWVAGGPLLVSPDGDSLAKFLLVAIAALIIFDIVVTLQRAWSIVRR